MPQTDLGKSCSHEDDYRRAHGRFLSLDGMNRLGIGIKEIYIVGVVRMSRFSVKCHVRVPSRRERMNLSDEDHLHRPRT